AADPREWASMVGYIGKEHLEISNQVRSLNEARRSLAGELNAARLELSRLHAAGNRSEKKVVVELAVERQGSLGLELRYFVGGARWEPLWDARLDPDSGKLSLGLRASVSQQSGEDWNGVQLAVSSVRPETSVYVPDLEPIYLR